MFGNLKSKIGDVTDLKKLSSPQALASVAGGSRQRSTQHTPGSLTPRSRHSRQASTASLQGLGLPISPPHSPLDQNGSLSSQDKVQELEREISKLRSALETQQDAALERLNAREQEWKAKLQEEKDKLSVLSGDLDAAVEREKRLQEQLENNSANKKISATKLSEAQARIKGLENKVCDLQDNLDQMEGLNTQEVAKIKHMLLNTNSELEDTKKDLKQKTDALTSAESRLNMIDSLEERIRALSEDKTSMEGQVTSLNHKLNTLSAKYNSLEETKEEEVKHLQSRIVTLEQRHSQTNLQETEKVQALIKERETMEHYLEEARQQLNNIKTSWSEKISALENQIQNLNSKIAEDQLDLQKMEKENSSLLSEISALKERNVSQETEKLELEKKLLAEINQQKEDLETLKWQLTNVTAEKEEQIAALSKQLEEEKELHKSCAMELESVKENLSSLKKKNSDTESELVTVKTNLTTLQNELQTAQSENKTLQGTLQQERTTNQTLEKNISELQSKLEMVTGEKHRLSQNLDEYVEKVNSLEKAKKQTEDDNERKSSELYNLEGNLQELQQECEKLREQISCSDDDLVRKIEESQLVKDLQQSIKNLEEDLGEKKQALKIQGQRLADMKKTIQRELRLSADATDSALDSHLELRPQMASPLLPAASASSSRCTGAAASNDDEEINGVNKTYLKHVIIKYLTSREYEAVHLTRAVATLLNMTEDEENLIKETLEWKMSWFGAKPNLGKGQKSLTIPPSY